MQLRCVMIVEAYTFKDSRDDGRTGNLLAVLLAIMIMTAHNHFSPFQEPAVPYKCYDLHGEVLHKQITDDTGERRLYVWFNDSISPQGYNLSVSQHTYDAFDVGDNYSGITCEFVDIEIIREFLQNWSV